VHPSETHSIYTLIRLISNLSQKSHQNLIEKFVWKIVPMINVDGNVLGNARRDACGTDLNRQYRKTLIPTSVVNDHIMRLCKSLKKEFQSNFALYLDFHDHTI